MNLKQLGEAKEDSVKVRTNNIVKSIIEDKNWINNIQSATVTLPAVSADAYGKYGKYTVKHPEEKIEIAWSYHETALFIITGLLLSYYDESFDDRVYDRLLSLRNHTCFSDSVIRLKTLNILDYIETGIYPIAQQTMTTEIETETVDIKDILIKKSEFDLWMEGYEKPAEQDKKQARSTKSSKNNIKKRLQKSRKPSTLKSKLKSKNKKG